MANLEPLPEATVVRIRIPTGFGIFQTSVKPWLDFHVGPMRHADRPHGLWEAWIDKDDFIEFRFRNRIHAGLFTLRWRGEFPVRRR